MIILQEGNLEFKFDKVVSAKKFDTHGLIVMKAVDFIVETNDRIYYIEVKDPQKNYFTRAEHEMSLKYKFRDSFLFE